MNNNNIPKVIVHPFQRDISIIKTQNIHYLPFEPNYSSTTSIEQLPEAVQIKSPFRQNDSFEKTVNNLISESCENIDLNISRTIHQQNDNDNILNGRTNLDQPIIQKKLINIENDSHIYGEKSNSQNATTHNSAHQLNDAQVNLSLVVDCNQSNNVNQIIDDLKEQLQVQLKVNSDLKKLLVASIGDDLQHKVDALVRTKVQLSDEINDYTNKLFEDYETLDKVTIQADLWHSKYQATKLLVERLTNELNEESKWRMMAESAFVDSLNERQIITDLLFQTYSQLQLMQLHIGQPQQINAHFKTIIHLARSNYNIIRSHVSNLIGCGGSQVVNGGFNVNLIERIGNGNIQTKHGQNGFNNFNCDRMCSNLRDNNIYNYTTPTNNILNRKEINFKMMINGSNDKLENGTFQNTNIPNLQFKNNIDNANCLLIGNCFKESIKNDAYNLNNLKLTVGLTSSEMLAHELLKPEMLEKCQYLPLPSNKKIFPRFHIETKYFGITYNCCPRCKGEIFSI